MGDTPLYRLWFLSEFGLKKGIHVDFDRYDMGPEIRCVFTFAWHWIFFSASILENL